MKQEPECLLCYDPGQERYNREYEQQEVNYQVLLNSLEHCLYL